MSRFPAETLKIQRKQIKDCCKNNLKEWSCGCSYGCPECYVRNECTVCGALYGYEISKELKGNYV